MNAQHGNEFPDSPSRSGARKNQTVLFWIRSETVENNGSGFFAKVGRLKTRRGSFRVGVCIQRTDDSLDVLFQKLQGSSTGCIIGVGRPASTKGSTQEWIRGQVVANNGQRIHLFFRHRGHAWVIVFTADTDGGRFVSSAKLCSFVFINGELFIRQIGQCGCSHNTSMYSNPFRHRLLN